MKKRIVSLLTGIMMLFSMIIYLPTYEVSATQSMSANFTGYTLTGNPANDIASVAEAQIGRSQSSLGYTEAWCADFVCDAAKIIGQSTAVPFYGACSGLYDRVIAAGGVKVSSPQRGDLVFYWCNSCNTYPHVGIMQNSTQSVEGNRWDDGSSKVVGNSTVFYDSNNHKTTDGTVVKVYVRPNYSGTGSTTKTNGIETKINEILAKFPNASYFSLNGSACTHSATSSCNNCKLSYILTRSDLSGLGYVKGTDYIDGWTCVAFARFAFRYIYGVQFDKSETNYYTVASGGFSQSTFSKAKIGDIIGFYNSSGTFMHYAVYIGNPTSTSVNLYHANFAGTPKVKYGSWTYSNMTSNYGSGSYAVIYRARNYDAINGGTSSTVTVPEPTNYPVIDGKYMIKNASNTAYYMNVYGGKDANSTKVVTWTIDTATDDQHLRFAHQGNGSYLIYAVSSASGRVLDISYASNTQVDIGDYLQIYDCGADYNSQIFNVVPVGNNKYVFELKNMDNAVLGMTSASNNAAITLQKYTGSDTQHWYICNYEGEILNPSEPIVTPTTTTDKSFYVLGDTIKFSWTESPKNSNLSHYWVRYYSPSGKTEGVRIDDGNSFEIVADEAGTYEITVSATPVGSESGEGSLTYTFNVRVWPERINLIIAGLLRTIPDQTYTGDEIKPEVSVTVDQLPLVEGVDYTVTYSNNINVGTATATITGTGIKYINSKSINFNIVPKSASGFTVSAISDQTYTGSAIKPAVTVKDGTKTLTSGTDYTVAYSNNTSVGTATVTITGKGNYSGTKSVTFKIVAKSASSFTVSAISNQTYTGSAIKPAVTVKDGTKTLTNGTDYTVAYSNNTSVGTATVTITGKGNYTGTKSVTFKIVAKSASGFTVSAIADQTYTGSAIKPTVTVKDGTKTLTNGTDYTVAYSNNTSVGTATVTITGKGNYTGTKTATFKIIANNAPQVIVESKNASAGQKVLVTVTMKNNPGIWGMDLELNYDKSLLTLTNVTNGTVFASSEWTPGNLNGNKYILSYEADGFENISANGTIAVLEFTVNANAAADSVANISLSYDDGDIINVSFDNISFATVSGKVKISDYIYGDLNDDGYVNKKDSLLLRMYLADDTTEINIKAADVYVDGSINKKDSLYLKQYLAGIDVQLGA